MPKTKFSPIDIVILVAIAAVLLGLMLSYASFKSSGGRRTKRNVTVERKIGEGAELDKEMWTMSIDASEIEFYHYSYPSSDRIDSVKFRGTDGKNALYAFKTFSHCVFSTYFANSGKLYETPCEFSYSDNGAMLNEEFTERDIAKLSELLKQLPEANAERLAKESKGEKEQSLFK